MSLWRQLTRGLHNLTHRRDADRDVADEVQQYLEDAASAWRERGLSAEEAQRAARIELGSAAAVEEQVRSYGWENALRTLAADLRYALRQLRGNPAFTVVTVLTLALGIGASTAIFSAVNPILFSPLPYPHANRIMMIWNTDDGARSEVAFGTYRELKARSRSFAAMAVYEPWQPSMTGGDEPVRLEGQSVSASFFRVLGVAPSLGRDFRASEDVFNGPKVVILSERLRQRLFRGNSDVLGREIKLDGDNYTIVGVMPRGFEDVLSPSAEIWTPEQYDTRQLASNFNSWEWGNHLRLIGRLKPGESQSQALQEIEQIAHTPWPEFPRPRWASLRDGLLIDSLQTDLAHSVKTALLAILGAVGLLLTIACVNVVNLLLARVAQRRGEFATRAALGASRGRQVRQLITESLLLSSLGGLLGVGMAIAAVRVLVKLSPPNLPRVDAIAVNGAAFSFALGITTLVGLVTGLIPAFPVSSGELSAALRQASRRTAGGHSQVRRMLVVVEVALALMLLVGAGLLLRSMKRVLAVSPGFHASHLLTMQVQTSGHQFDNLPSDPGAGDAMRQRFYEQALDAVRRVPGVQAAAFTSLLPLSDDPPVVGVYGAQFENDDPQKGSNVFRYAVSPGYCRTMGIPLISGRFLDKGDTRTAPQVALISKSLARRQFPGQSALGKRLHVGPRNRPWYTVVGVVGDVKQTSLAIENPDAVYIPTQQSWFADDALSFVIRTRGDAATFATAAKNAVWSVDKNQPIVRVATMDKLLAVTEAERRFVLVLFEAFGAAALMLAAVGIYGILSGSVTERMREIGVRAALGASRADILSLVLGDGMRLTAFGIVIGLGAARAASRAVATLLFGISRLDAVTYLSVTALMAIVAAIACWTPAWRASRVDPSIMLRADQ
jgi:putative ABC transport system permease protein